MPAMILLLEWSICSWLIKQKQLDRVHTRTTQGSFSTDLSQSQDCVSVQHLLNRERNGCAAGESIQPPVGNCKAGPRKNVHITRHSPAVPRNQHSQRYRVLCSRARKHRRAHSSAWLTDTRSCFLRVSVRQARHLCTRCRSSSPPHIEQAPQQRFSAVRPHGKVSNEATRARPSDGCCCAQAVRGERATPLCMRLWRRFETGADCARTGGARAAARCEELLGAFVMQSVDCPTSVRTPHLSVLAVWRVEVETVVHACILNETCHYCSL